MSFRAANYTRAIIYTMAHSVRGCMGTWHTFSSRRLAPLIAQWPQRKAIGSTKPELQLHVPRSSTMELYTPLWSMYN
jgi:hypothetical protein